MRVKDTTAKYLARKRDGVCLYGLLHKDGTCSTGLDAHHIQGVGEGGHDVLTNLISLCRWHHNQVELANITKEECYAILSLYHGYKYEGIEPWTKRFLETKHNGTTRHRA
jgi:predicted restriction endonuclease